MELTQKHKEYWRKNVRITAVLMVIWALVTYGIGFYARDLTFNFFGWPFSFWIGAQGAPAIYVALIGFYAWYMNRLDKDYGVAEGDE